MRVEKTGFASAVIFVFIALAAMASVTSAGDVLITTSNTHLGKMVIINPLPSDTVLANGTALSNALSGITDASATNPYIIKLGPGVYDLGAGSLQMKAYVDLEGSGEKTTKITSSTTSGGTVTTGTVKGVTNAEIRFVTVENTGIGASTYAAAFYNSGASPAMTHMTAKASGAAAYGYGIYNGASSSPVITNVTAESSAATTANYGVYNSTTSNAVMTSVTATAKNGVGSYAVWNMNSTPVMTQVTAEASGATGSNSGVYNSTSPAVMTNVTATGMGGGTTFGVYNYNAGPVLTNVIATGQDGTTNHGIYNSATGLTMTQVSATGSGGTNSHGMYNTASGSTYTINIDRSYFTGTTNSIRNDAEFTLKIGSSRLSGAINNGTGTFTCVASYDGNYAALTSTCVP